VCVGLAYCYSGLNSAAGVNPSDQVGARARLQESKHLMGGHTSASYAEQVGLLGPSAIGIGYWL
jgi:hypothetical protein